MCIRDRDSREEPDLPAESPESSGQELQEAAALSPEETQVPFQTENAWEPGAERPENPDGGESQEPVAERPSAQPYDQSPAFSRPAPQTPPPVWNPGWQAPYHQAPQNYPYGQGQYQGGWHPQQRQVPPPYYGGTPYQAPNPYQNQAPYGYPGQAARNQGQPGYQESRWYPQQPAQPARTGSVPPPSQPPQKEAGELPDAKPPEKKRMNKKTKAFLWVIGAVLVLLGAAMVLYSVGSVSYTHLDVYKRQVTVCVDGAGIEFSEEKAKEILLEKEIDILVDLKDGSFDAEAYGCDLTYDYVKINGDYRT